MLYAKGGAAWAGDKYSADLPAFNEHIETSVTRPGWTVGGGLEWAFWNNWSAKVEYNFYNFDTRNLAFPGTIAGVPEVVPSIDIKETLSTVKFGVNYHQLCTKTLGSGPLPAALLCAAPSEAPLTTNLLSQRNRNHRMCS